MDRRIVEFLSSQGIAEKSVMWTRFEYAGHRLNNQRRRFPITADSLDLGYEDWSNTRILVNVTVIFTENFTMKYPFWNEFRLLCCKLSIRSVFTHGNIKLILFWEFSLRQETLIQQSTVTSCKMWFSISTKVEVWSLAFMLSLKYLNSLRYRVWVHNSHWILLLVYYNNFNKEECILWRDNL